MTEKELEVDLEDFELRMLEIDAELEILIPKRDAAIKKDEERNEKLLSKGIIANVYTSSEYSTRIKELEKEKDELQAKIVARKKMLERMKNGNM